MVETGCGLCSWGEPAGPRFQASCSTAGVCKRRVRVHGGCHDIQTLPTGQERQACSISAVEPIREGFLVLVKSGCWLVKPSVQGEGDVTDPGSRAAGEGRQGEAR